MREPYQYCPMCGKLLELGVIEGKERKFCTNCNFVEDINKVIINICYVFAN